MGCRSFSQSYLNLLNCLMFVLSLVIIGYCGYLASQLADLTDVLSTSGIVALLVFAVFLLITSVVGLVGVNKGWNTLIIVYFVVASVVTIVVFAVGVALLVSSGVLSNIENEQVEIAAGTTESELQDLMFAVFNKCCADRFGFPPAVVCADGNTDGCINDENTFEELFNNLPEEVCEALEEIELNDAPLVGNATGCGDGDAATFVSNISQFIADNIKPLGIANLIMAVLMILILVASCVMLCSGNKSEKKKKQEEAPQDQYGDKVGPEIAG